MYVSKSVNAVLSFPQSRQNRFRMLLRLSRSTPRSTSSPFATSDQLFDVAVCNHQRRATATPFTGSGVVASGADPEVDDATTTQCPNDSFYVVGDVLEYVCTSIDSGSLVFVSSSSSFRIPHTHTRTHTHKQPHDGHSIAKTLVRKVLTLRCCWLSLSCRRAGWRLASGWIHRTTTRQQACCYCCASASPTRHIYLFPPPSMN